MSIPIDTTKSPGYYSKEVESIKQRFSIIINEGKNAVPLATTYPNNQSYQEMASLFKSNLKEYKSDSFMLRNGIENDMETFEKTSEKTAEFIAMLEKKNKGLKNEITELIQTNNGTKGLFKDSQLLYSQYLLGNLYILASIISVPIYIYYTHQSK
jgi:hypothetical protein